MRAEDQFEQLVEEPFTVLCKECQGAMLYKKRGIYKCSLCGWEYLSQFGKVKQFIETHGACTATEISEATGVSIKTIFRYISEGRIEKIRRL